MIKHFKIRSVMWCHYKITSISIYNWWAHLSISVNSTVYTVARSDVVRSHTNSYILTFIDWEGFINSCNHYGAVYTVTNLHELDISINVDVTILTTNYSNIFILEGLVFDSHTFIQSIHIGDFILRFMGWNNLT